jgi:membrane protein
MAQGRKSGESNEKSDSNDQDTSDESVVPLPVGRWVRHPLRQIIRQLEVRLRGRSLVIGLMFDWIAHMARRDLTLLAASLAFSSVLAVVPLLAVSLSVFNAFGGFETILPTLKSFLFQNLTGTTSAQVTQFLERSVQRIHSGALGLTGAVTLLFIATKLFHDVERAIQRVFESKPTRSLWVRVLVYWGIIFLGPVLLAVALGVLGSKDLALLRALPAALLASLLFFSVLLLVYRYVPQSQVSWRAAFWAALFGTLALLVLQQGFGWASKQLMSYNRIYGSLAAFPLFLIWIQAMWWICLSAGAVAVVVERRIRGLS